MPRQRSDDDGPTVQHNSKARAKIIRDVCVALADLEEQRAEINAQMREIRNEKIKGSLDMKISDFNACYRLYKLEGEDRDRFLDTLRETFEALGVGGQLDFVDALKAEQPVAGSA